MRDNQTLLVIIAFIFATVLFLISQIRGPRMGIINRDIYFDRSRLPTYFGFLLLVAVFSVPLGYLLVSNLKLGLEFAGLNLLVGAIMGANLILYRKHPRN